jgi:major membrane immunogen (membrane-anchored lipoprotein)
MQGPIVFCLLGLVLLSGCGNSTSPILEKVRPHLQSGANQTDLIQLLGNPTFDLGSDKEGNQHRLTYNLDGKYRGKILELRFWDGKLTAAVVLGPDPSDPKKAYTIIVEEVLKPAQ